MISILNLILIFKTIIPQGVWVVKGFGRKILEISAARAAPGLNGTIGAGFRQSNQVIEIGVGIVDADHFTQVVEVIGVHGGAGREGVFLQIILFLLNEIAHFRIDLRSLFSGEVYAFYLLIPLFDARTNCR